MSEVLQVLLYGLLAAASPSVLLASLAALSTGPARANGSTFAGGFLLGQSLGLFVPLLIGASIPSSGSSSTVWAFVQLGVGLILLAAAYRARQPRPASEVNAESRTTAFLARLTRVTPRTAFSIGVPLGIGVKRLIISTVAASTIALSGLSHSEELALGVLYVLVASLLVWLPVAVYIIAGKRADAWVTSLEEWLAANRRQLTFFTSLVFGVLFAVGALIQLL
jgi:hypothetical protein